MKDILPTQPNNHYEILGVDEKAEHIDIKNAHRKLALQYHPDKRSTATQQDHNEAESMYIKIQAAWECLGDEQKRMEYDESLKRIRERNSGDVIKAQVVNLCEMKCEVCDVEEDSNCNSGDDLPSQEGSKQRLYTFTCRCGDCFEILEEELDNSYNRVSDSNIFHCESCSLSIKIVL